MIRLEQRKLMRQQMSNKFISNSLQYLPSFHNRQPKASEQRLIDNLPFDITKENKKYLNFE